jgi:hypothetical protein
MSVEKFKTAGTAVVAKKVFPTAKNLELAFGKLGMSNTAIQTALNPMDHGAEK